MSRSLGYALVTALIVSVSPGMAQHGVKDGEWRAYGGDVGSSRYAPFDQITRDNVKNLQVAWSWRFDNFGGGTSETTPIMANGILYFTVGQRRNVIAVNPGTGETLWTWRPDEGARFDQAQGLLDDPAYLIALRSDGVARFPGGFDRGFEFGHGLCLRQMSFRARLEGGRAQDKCCRDGLWSTTCETCTTSARPELVEGRWRRAGSAPSTSSG